MKNECPLGNNSNLYNIIYQANISTKQNYNNKALVGMKA